LHVRVIHEKFQTLLLHWFQKIRQKLLSKETYVALGKAAAIVYELGLHDTLRDLKVKSTTISRFECAPLDPPRVYSTQQDG